ncbi:Hypothetical predicted protein [Pelobates cultripes]|uniref:Uncharacterized protein n=1 Tax=Pelobates cultripes TaxID=61616 RepID=A0AAD1WV72_PELCU|nr:Hypothetical predicted protein [Pelobates cultripes]
MESSNDIRSQLVGICIWLGISIAMIIMGAIYKDDCAIQPYIPIYLIVGGAAHFLGFSLIFFRLACQTFNIFLEGLTSLLSFVWFISGSVWVFSVYTKYEGQCNQHLYLFAFGILLVQYVQIGLLMICSCCCCSPRSNSYESV